ncbi:MAG: OmpA family protein [Muribaculaceae bacterium]|nr:OmpA family protein [Muribaculaceae bacterium]
MKIFFKGCALAGVMFASQTAFAQTALPRIDELDELSFSEMINSVELDAKSADLIRKFQEKEGRNRLYNKEYNSKNSSMVETYRNKEVLLVTIPASKLFAPNEVEVRKDAAHLLAPLKRYLKEPDMYRVLLVMHTDNTGSEKYREHITEERSTALFDWFVKEGCDTRYLFSYAYGDDMPLEENNSLANREKNRRLEVYLVPGKKMLEQAKKGRIVF